MKTAKLLQKTEAFLSAKKSKQRKKIDALKEMLDGLKQKKREMNEKIKAADSKSEREHLEKELAVIRAQRHKGLKILKDLK